MLPPPVETNNERFTAGLSPQDITDRRVDANNERANLEFDRRFLFGPPPYSQLYGGNAYRDDLSMAMRRAKEVEDAYEHAQRRLDQQTMTRMGQQGEADEMDAMGVPDMGRSVGGRAPPNVGRAGNSQMTFPSHSLTEEEIEGGLDDLTPPNPFPRPSTDAGSFVGGQPRSYFFGKSLDAAFMLLKNQVSPKPLAGRVQDQLAEFVDDAGRQPAMSPETDYSKHENSTDLYHDSFDENDDFNPINSVPTDAQLEGHNIASTNIKETPRKTKRGQMDEPRATPRMQGRAARSPSPFVGGQ